MKKLLLPVFCILAFLFVVSCGSSDEPVAPKSEPDETVFDPMLETLDRAKRVEQFSKDRMQQLDQQLEEDEKGQAPRNESR